VTPRLELVGVSRTFGVDELAVPALRNVSMQADEGEFVAIMGPSGSGKSTLLAICGCLDVGYSGEVLIHPKNSGGGRRARSVAPMDPRTLSMAGLARCRRQLVGLVFQQYNLVPSLTALENIALPLELDGVPVRKARKQAFDALTAVDLVGLEDRFADQLSGGQQQRVAIARGIVGDRRLLLADEPTGALDSHTGEEIMEVLRARADAGTTVLMVTHDARHAAWADRVVFLRDGRIVDSAESISDPSVLLAEHSA